MYVGVHDSLLYMNLSVHSFIHSFVRSLAFPLVHARSTPSFCWPLSLRFSPPPFVFLLATRGRGARRIFQFALEDALVDPAAALGHAIDKSGGRAVQTAMLLRCSPRRPPATDAAAGSAKVGVAISAADVVVAVDGVAMPSPHGMK